jgi:hypothetical protein
LALQLEEMLVVYLNTDLRQFVIGATPGSWGFGTVGHGLPPIVLGPCISSDLRHLHIRLDLADCLFGNETVWLGPVVRPQETSFSAAMPDDETLQARCYRWVLRGDGRDYFRADGFMKTRQTHRRVLVAAT